MKEFGREVLTVFVMNKHKVRLILFVSMFSNALTKRKFNNYYSKAAKSV